VRYVGLDVHRNWCQIAEVDDRGEVVREGRLPMDPDVIAAYARQHWSSDTHVLIEATGNSHLVYEVLSPLVGKVLLADPNRLKVISHAKVKTDKVDALMLAQLLRANLVPEVWVAPAELRRLGHLAGHRIGLRRTATAFKNRIHAVLRRNGIRLPVSDVFGRQGRALLKRKGSSLPEEDRLVVETSLNLLGAVEREIGQVEDAIAVRAQGLPEVGLLMSIPGVDVFSAVVILTEIGDITRFSSPKHLSSYAGLAPTVHASGDTVYTGHISKRGRKALRWVLIQVVLNAVRKPGRLRSFYLRLRARKGTAVARVAAARKLLTYIWSMLTAGEVYADVDLTLHHKKETALRRRVVKLSRRQATMRTQDTARGEHREAVAPSAIPAGFP